MTSAKQYSLYLLVCCLALLLVLAACAGGTAPTMPADPIPSPAPAGELPSPVPELTPAPGSPPPQLQESVPALDLYEFGTPLEETEPLEDDSFFSGAVFLGDSRTEGLELFSGLENGTFYWARGMSVFQADSDSCRIFEVDGEMVTLLGALKKNTYDAVYIMIGINELGYSAEHYESGLSDLLDKVIAAQPGAVIYLQTLPPVNDSEARQNGLADYINNTQVDAFNEAIVRAAADKKVVLLNTAEVYRDEDGQLPSELSSDGCHFAVRGYALWADYLRCHVMDAERYFDSREVSGS